MSITYGFGFVCINRYVTLTLHTDLDPYVMLTLHMNLDPYVTLTLHTNLNPYVKSLCTHFTYGFGSICKNLYVNSKFLVVIYVM